MNKASGICPDEPDELERVLEDITGMEQGQQEQLAVDSKRERNSRNHKEKGYGENGRDQGKGECGKRA